MGKRPWRSETYEKSFDVLMDEADPKLSRDRFDEKFNAYLRAEGFQYHLDKPVRDKLFKKACDFRKRFDAFAKLKTIVESEDWKRRKALASHLLSSVPRLQKTVTEYRGQDFRMTNKLARWVLGQLQPIVPEIEKLEKCQLLDTGVISNYLRPPLESQFLLWIDDYLAPRLSHLKMRERRFVVGACAVATGLFPAGKESEDIQGKISMRILRAKRSIKKSWESGKIYKKLASRSRR